jgi:hypothetical protein
VDVQTREKEISSNSTVYLFMIPGGDVEHQDEWREYGALEARIQNDSRVAYSVFGATLTASLTLAGLLLVYVDFAEDPAKFLTLAGLALSILEIGRRIQDRFNDTSGLRIARAVQLERTLGIHSFRLFPPWYEFPDGYFLTLGERTSGSKSDGSSTAINYFDYKGKKEYERVITDTRVSKRLFWVGFGIIVAIVLVAVSVSLVH